MGGFTFKRIGQMISVNIATHKAREPFLKKCLESLLAQNTKPDLINVYLNDYRIQPWQQKLESESNVTFIDGGFDLGATAKFWFADTQENGVYITLDDDLVAAPEYVGYLADCAFRYPTSIVGLHGTNYQRRPVQSYYMDKHKSTFYCYHENNMDRQVDMLGSGCIAFRVGMNKVPTLDDFPKNNMTDPYMVKFAAKYHKAFICLSRGKGLVFEQPNSQSAAIWKTLLADESHQTKIVNKYLGFRPAFEDLKKIQFGDAAVEWGHMKLMMGMIKHDSKVVEFGSGLSTKAFQAICENITSFEHNKNWLSPGVSYRPLDEKTGWYNITNHDKRAIENADFVFVDGPIGSEGGRYKLPFKLLNINSTIFIDDCQRPEDLKQAQALAGYFDKSLGLVQGQKKILGIIK